jgi:hypothetical protein
MPPAGELASAVAVLATGRRRCEARGRSDRKQGPGWRVRSTGRWVVEIGMQVNRAISVRECSSPSVTDADVLRTANEPNTGHDMQGFGTQLDSRISLTTTAGVLSSTAVFIIASDPCVGKWSPELDRGRSLPCASVLQPRPLRRCGNMSRRRLSRTIYQALRPSVLLRGTIRMRRGAGLLSHPTGGRSQPNTLQYRCRVKINSYIWSPNG